MCCLFGLFDYGGFLSDLQKNRTLSALAKECEVRGIDATGIAYNTGASLHIFKKPLPAHRLRFRIPHGASVVMGHTRMTTQGSEKKNYNNHPFRGKAGGTDFALAHNGMIYNDADLRRARKLPHTKIQTDSYIAVQLIEKQKALNLDTLRNMAEQIEGSFSFTVLDKANHLYLIKGNNPLYILRYPKAGLLIYASTKEILEKAMPNMHLPSEAPEHIPLDSGEIAKVDCSGQITRTKFSMNHLWLNRFPLRGITCCRNGRAKRYHLPLTTAEDMLYLEDLKSVASSFGYSSEDIDHLLALGLTFDEIESYLYEIDL